MTEHSSEGTSHLGASEYLRWAVWFFVICVTTLLGLTYRFNDDGNDLLPAGLDRKLITKYFTYYADIMVLTFLFSADYDSSLRPTLVGSCARAILHILTLSLSVLLAVVLIALATWALRQSSNFSIQAAATVLDQLLLIGYALSLVVVAVLPGLAYFIAGAHAVLGGFQGDGLGASPAGWFAPVVWFGTLSLPTRILIAPIAVVFALLLFALNALMIFRLVQFVGSALRVGSETIADRLRCAIDVLRAAFGPYLPFARGVAASVNITTTSVAEFGSQHTNGSTLDVLVIADSHIPAHDGAPIIGSRRPFDSTRRFVNEKLAQDLAPVMVHCGGVTDRGAPEEWDYAEQVFGLLRPRLVVAPGNHDLNFSWSWHPRERMSQEISDREILARLKCVAVTQTAEECFPHIVRLPGIDILVFNKNRRPSSNVLTNALGLVGKDQLAKARELVAERQPGKPLLLVLHHHIFRPLFGLQNILLRCLDADEVFQFAMDHRVAAIVHGHKHMPYVVRYASPCGDELVVVSVGSTTS